MVSDEADETCEGENRVFKNGSNIKVVMKLIFMSICSEILTRSKPLGMGQR